MTAPLWRPDFAIPYIALCPMQACLGTLGSPKAVLTAFLGANTCLLPHEIAFYSVPWQQCSCNRSCAELST